MKTDIGTPLLLTGEVNSTSGAGKLLPFNTADFQAPARQALLIEEFLFDNFVNGDTTSAGVKVRIGKHDIVPDPLPPFMLGVVPNRYAELHFSHYVTNCLGPVVWRLEEPIYVPPATAISIVAGNGVATTTYREMCVSILARALPQDFPKPKTTKMPYVVGYVPSAAATRHYLKEDDLKNGLDGPVFVKHLVGRVLSSSGEDLTPGVADLLWLKYGTSEICADAPFNTVFDPCRRQLPLGLTLQPGECLTGRIQRNASSSPCLAMFCEREVSL